MLEGALVAIDNHTGEVLAMVGGYSFARSKFNRATQAYRQMGSTVKPILYTAAIDRGLTPTTILVDEPTTFDAGAGQPPYTPGNYDRKFMGPLTLRRALEQSRNIPAVKVIDMLGPTQVAAYAKKFGFPQDFRPFLSMALGAQEATLIEITSAYSAFPNHGIRMEPYLAEAITDRDGSLLEERRPQPRDAIRADTAYVHDQPAARRRAARHRRPPPTRSTGRWPARPAPWTTTPTRGSSASIPTSRSACGSATTRRSRSAPARPAPPRRCRSGSTS